MREGTEGGRKIVEETFKREKRRERKREKENESKSGLQTPLGRFCVSILGCDIYLRPHQAHSLYRETKIRHHCGYSSFKSAMRRDSDTTLNTSPIDPF